MKNFLNATFKIIFWVWNITFLIFAYIGILPWVGIPLIEATFAGLIPAEFLITLVGLIAVPTACTFVGGVRFRNQPLQLIRLFYGVEAPLFALGLLRLFVLREMTGASLLMMGTIAACIAAFLGELLGGYARERRSLAWLQTAAHSLMLFFGIYLGVLLLFYAVPFASFLLREFFAFRWIESLWYSLTHSYSLENLWWSFVTLLLLTFSCTLFLAMPSALASLYVYSGYSILRNFAAQYGQKRAIQGALATLSLWLVLFVSLVQQPQMQAFQLLENPVQTDSARAELIAKSDAIRPGLVNAYLSSYRYVSTVKGSNYIKHLYKSVFDLPDPLCNFLQDSYNRLMSPFLYNGDGSDSQKAEKLYAQFFDQPIQKAEQTAILHALQSTVNQEEAKAGLLNIGEKKVWLRSQQVNVQENGDFANVELYEVYENKTAAIEEVLYYFSLPESATLTGVWLGDSNNREKRFPFTVSPRGAAQKVYNAQVRRSMDPALLEQVGPRHYRLRAFPIPTPLTPSEKRSKSDRATEMHLWMTYKVMRQEKGWALPILGEKRNIFWTENTQRIRNGKAVKNLTDNWLEAFLPASQAQLPKEHEVKLLNDYRIVAKPLSKKDYSLPQNQRFAVILDTSRSMKEQASQVVETFNWLKKQGFADKNLANNDADLYLTASEGKQPQRIDELSQFNADKITFYGTLQLKEMLRQFAQLQGNTAYDGILLVTDEGSYELSDNSKEVPPMTAPLWLVHLGAMPRAYDDATLKAIQNSGGGVSEELPEVLQRMATQTALGKSAVSVVDGYAWFVEKTVSKNPSKSAKTPVNQSQTGFDALAARQLVLALSQKVDKEQLADLDAIHAIAKTFQIVTPYSSMLVLVNDEQREALKKAEAEKDRFDREVEDGKEELTQPNNPLNVASVPEPGTIGAIVGFSLFAIANRKRLNKVSRDRS